MSSRLHFIKNLGGISIGLGTLGFDPNLIGELDLNKLNSNKSDLSIAQDEEYWKIVQKAFQQSKDFINLENGYFSPQPESTMDSQIRNIKMINSIPSYYMRKKQYDEKLKVKKKLAAFVGVSHEEIVITRNTTEALDTIISGIDLQPGDEVLMSDQDYSSMIQAYDQQAKRYGIKPVLIQFPLLPKSKFDIVRAFEKGITAKTKILLMSHVINATGTVLPVQEISTMAKSNEVDVMIDRAHSFAHLDFKIAETGCDYFGCSLHKWLCAPLGTGMLYVKRDKIPKIWPLYGDSTYEKNDIRKLEHQGTHPVSDHLSISNAIDFHNAIGSSRKEARLKYLKSYWTEKVKGFKGLTFNTPLENEYSCAITNISIKDQDPKDVANNLLDKYGIFTTQKSSPAVDGIRITPHLFTRLEDLDKLVEALHDITNS